MPVTHQPSVTIIGQFVGMAAEEARNLGLHRMRQQRSRAVAQHVGQWIGKRPWLRQLDDIILGHGVSLLQWRSGGVEHPHDTPPYPFTPSPTSAHNSAAARAKPDAILYGTVGPGSDPYLTTLQLFKAIGAQGLHIPFNGGGALAPALLAHTVSVVVEAP